MPRARGVSGVLLACFTRLNRGVNVPSAWLVAALAIAFSAQTTEAKLDVPSPRAQAALRAAFLESLTPLQPLDDTAWVLSGLSQSQRYRLTPSETLAWIERYVRPSRKSHSGVAEVLGRPLRTAFVAHRPDLSLG